MEFPGGILSARRNTFGRRLLIAERKGCSRQVSSEAAYAKRYGSTSGQRAIQELFGQSTCTTWRLHGHLDHSPDLRATPIVGITSLKHQFVIVRAPREGAELRTGACGDESLARRHTQL